MSIGIVLIVTTFVTLDVFRTKPLYRATATIEIGRETETRASSVEVVFQEYEPLSVSMNTNEVIVRSAPLLEDVTTRLQLDRNPAFADFGEKNSFWQALHEIVGSVRQDPARDRRVFTETTPVRASIAGRRSPQEIERLSPFVGLIQNSLAVRPIRDTRAMTIAFTHPDPGIAASVANTVAERFVETSFDKKVEKFTRASEWLDRSTRELKAKIERSEQALADYTKNNNIYSIEGKQTLITEKLARLHDQATRAETDRILKESLAQQVRQGRIDQIPEAFADSQVAELQRKQRELAVTAAELSVTYGPKYPKMAEVQQQLSVIREQIADSRSRLEGKLNADYERALHDEVSLKGMLDQAKAEAATENVSAIQYNILKQDVETAKSLYTEFLQKTNEAYLEVAQQHSNIRIISPAPLPKAPISPHRQRTILLGLMLSLAGAVALALLLERLDDSIRDIEDASRLAQVPGLAVIPKIDRGNSILVGRRSREIASDGAVPGSAGRVAGETQRAWMNAQRARLMQLDVSSPIAEAYRSLRTALLLSVAGSAPRTILVTSVRKDDGKTTTATNMAISLAQLSASVLLIDGDLRKPVIHSLFGIPQRPGLSTYLSGEAQPAELTQAFEKDNLHLIAAGTAPGNPAELLSSQRMRRLLTELAGRYDHIVIDSPPITDVTDAVILSTMVDGVILVVHGGRNSRQAVQRVCQKLSAVGARLFGIVLNNVDLRRDGYGAYDFYSYRRDYAAYGSRSNTSAS
jgi:capsular exopolysaccharide synthesis family protein